jgi:hypothetical protein
MKHQGNTPLNSQYTLKNEGEEGKTGSIWGWVPGGRVGKQKW